MIRATQRAAITPIQIFTARGVGRHGENCVAGAMIWVHAECSEATRSRPAEADPREIANSIATASIDDNIAIRRCFVVFVVASARSSFIESS